MTPEERERIVRNFHAAADRIQDTELLLGRPELELVVQVAGQLELEADGPPCELCSRPTNRWSDLCDTCNVGIMELADFIGEPKDLR